MCTNSGVFKMVSFTDEVLLCISYIAVSLVSFNCLNIYVNFVGSQSRAYTYGIFIINGLYGIGGAVSSVSSSLNNVQVIFYAAEMSLVLPFLATEMWIQKQLFPKQQELIYVPCLLGILPFFSFIMLGVIRIDLIELCLVYCCVSIAYMGHTTKDYLVVAASLLFYIAYSLHYRGLVKISNVLLVLFTLCSLGSICPICIEESKNKNVFIFNELGF